jgi:hypothetical protein
MSTTWLGGIPAKPPSDPLVERWAYFVDVCSFTFQFRSIDQLRKCLQFFEQPIRPTSRLPNVTLEHYWQRWHERLPQWLFSEPKRQKVVRALERAVREFEGSGVDARSE